MVVSVKEDRSLSFKNGVIGVNEEGEVCVVEVDKDGNVTTTNFLEAIVDLFGEESCDIKVTRKRDI